MGKDTVQVRIGRDKGNVFRAAVGSLLAAIFGTICGVWAAIFGTRGGIAGGCRRKEVARGRGEVRRRGALVTDADVRRPPRHRDLRLAG